MQIRIRETGAVIFQDEFRRLHNDTSFPADITPDLLNEFGADQVFEGHQPTLSNTQYSFYAGVEQIGSQWFTKYEAREYTTEELQARLEQQRASMVCSPYQGKAALFQAGLLDDVESLIANSATDTLTKLAWSNATEWKRLSPMIVSLSSALGLTDSQIDDLFTEAAKVTA